MQKNIENRLESFVRAELAGVHRIEMTHGTMYLVLDKPGDCDFIHREIRKFYKENINPEGGVNMYAVGEEFAFDFVPEDREAPVFMDKDKDESDIDTALNLEAESLRNKAMLHILQNGVSIDKNGEKVNLQDVYNQESETGEEE